MYPNGCNQSVSVVDAVLPPRGDPEDLQAKRIERNWCFMQMTITTETLLGSNTGITLTEWSFSVQLQFTVHHVCITALCIIECCAEVFSRQQFYFQGSVKPNRLKWS